MLFSRVLSKAFPSSVITSRSGYPSWWGFLTRKPLEALARAAANISPINALKFLIPSVENSPSETSSSFEIVSSKIPTASLKSSMSKSAVLFLPRNVTFLIFLNRYLCILIKKVRDLHPQCFYNFLNVFQSDVLFGAFNHANICAMNTCLRGQFFLRPTESNTLLAHFFTKFD